MRSITSADFTSASLRSLPPPCSAQGGRSIAVGHRARRGESVPGTTRSVVGLWQRLNFWPLPHQHGSLGFILDRAMIGGGHALDLGSQDGTGGTDDVERAGDQDEVVGAGQAQGPMDGLVDRRDASATMPSPSAARGHHRGRDRSGRVRGAGDHEAGVGAHRAPRASRPGPGPARKPATTITVPPRVNSSRERVGAGERHRRGCGRRRAPRWARGARSRSGPAP